MAVPYAAIGAGIKAVSSLLGGRKARKAEARAAALARAQQLEDRAFALEDTINQGFYARQAAERGGFNPLTMLAAGGGVVRDAGPVLTGGGGFGGAGIADAGDALGSWFANIPQNDAEVAEAKLREKKAVEALFKKSFQTPPDTFGYDLTKVIPSVQPGKLGYGAMSGAAVATAAMSDTGTLPAKLSLYSLGNALDPVSGSSDAESFSARYGEIAGELEGLKAWVTDMYKRKQTRARLDGTKFDFGPTTDKNVRASKHKDAYDRLPWYDLRFQRRQFDNGLPKFGSGW